MLMLDAFGFLAASSSLERASTSGRFVELFLCFPLQDSARSFLENWRAKFTERRGAWFPRGVHDTHRTAHYSRLLSTPRCFLIAPPP